MGVTLGEKRSDFPAGIWRPGIFLRGCPALWRVLEPMVRVGSRLWVCLPEIFSSGFGSPVDSAFPESRKTSRDSTGVQKADRESLVRHAGLQTPERS